MGAIKGSVTVRRYIVRGTPGDQDRLLKGIQAHAFMPIDPASDLDRSSGWVSILDASDTSLSAGAVCFDADLALALRLDTLRPPAALVKRLVEEGLRALGRKPNKAEKTAYKAEIVRQLRHRLFPATRTFDVVWSVDTGRVVFFSHGKGPNEILLELFKKSFGLELVPDGPGEAVRRAGLAPRSLVPTEEMVLGFPGMPGRTLATDDDGETEIAEGELGSEAA